jgi:uncharacterized integral membrane protein
MRSNLLKSLVAFALVASPTIGSTQVGAEAERETSLENDNDRVLGALFVGVIFAIVLLVYVTQEEDGDGTGAPVSP